ncbi:hypothetical protein CUT44_08165 [Streptomyces carminius]|uniref:MmpS family membrane protein n=1 Tax=Streptomyces carminius TaxID=2665496 RepID=A0A2M8M200_9ACTN|nr:hypothetical protein [Streptomyces carminius]PJE98234.1 hypothetical protein CUT44_08165 [Streptomyces carminius]
MRRTVITTPVLAAAAVLLLAGCGGGDGDGGGAEKDTPSAGRSEQPEKDGGDGGEKDGAKGDEVTREVTLEVEGTGKTQIAYVAGSNATEQVTLPWSKTVELSLTPAEQKVGVLVSVLPGTVQDLDGQLKPAPCAIEVDGEQVDDNNDGRDVTGCTHLLK